VKKTTVALLMVALMALTVLSTAGIAAADYGHQNKNNCKDKDRIIKLPLYLERGYEQHKFIGWVQLKRWNDDKFVAVIWVNRDANLFGYDGYSPYVGTGLRTPVAADGLRTPVAGGPVVGGPVVGNNLRTPVAGNGLYRDGKLVVALNVEKWLGDNRFTRDVTLKVLKIDRYTRFPLVTLVKIPDWLLKEIRCNPHKILAELQPLRFDGVGPYVGAAPRVL